MRVITGIAKGRKLFTPKNNRVRPTTDRIKESIFNIISDRIDDCFFMDCFSGTGSMGIEAASRGAHEIYLIDNHKESLQVINKNIKITGFNENMHVLPMDIFRGLEYLKDKKIKFDIIFMDPPYNLNIITQCIEEISNKDLLNDNGIIIAEHDKNYLLNEQIGNIRVIDARNYGNSSITLYEKVIK